jgi:hypothetical protein
MAEPTAFRWRSLFRGTPLSNGAGKPCPGAARGLPAPKELA